MSTQPATSSRTRRTLRRGAPIVVAGAIGAAGALAVDGHGASAPSGAASRASASPAVARPVASTTGALSAAALYRRDAPGVVDIEVSTVSSQAGQFGGGESSGAEGSGFVLDTAGDIVTNAHVVADASAITVTLNDGTTGKATLVGTDTSSDLAVIRVSLPKNKLHPLTLGSSASVQPGQSVVAIGSPFGYAKTITAGIISATGRQIQAPNGATIAGALQTDAAINPGNSGGPLIDTTGAVIGVNAQIKSSSDGNEGVGFAIPIDTVRSVTQSLIAGRTVRHAFLGVRLSDASSGGAQIASVDSGSAAADAGLRQGDVVTAVDDTSVSSSGDLAAAVAGHAPGDRVGLTFTRDGQSQRITVTLGARSS